MKYLLIATNSSAGTVDLTDTRFAVHILNGLLSGNVELYPIQSASGNGLIVIDTVRFPTNGVVDTDFEYLSKSDEDTDLYVSVEDKVVSGNLFLTVVDGTDMDINLNEIRKVCSNVESRKYMFAGSSGSKNLSVVFGVLKETQTQDYNPLDKIGADYKRDYVMMSPALATENVILRSELGLI